VNATKFRFWPGDIIFGKRRCYQRKLAVAEFEGICSAHAMVLRAKEDKVDKKFLPLFIQSDMFMERALAISVGSLSPTINWKTLRQQEFPLPPKDEQCKIAEILWAADEAVEAIIDTKQKNKEFYDTEIKHLLFNNHKNNGKVVCVKDIAKINKKTLSENHVSSDFKFDYIDISSVIAPKRLGNLQTLKFTEAPSRARRYVEIDDILVSTVRPNLQAFVRILKSENNMIASTGFAVITPRDTVTGSLLYHAFFSKKFLRYCNARVTGTSYPAIKAKDIADFKIFIPNGEECKQKVQRILDTIDICIEKIEANLRSMNAFKKALLEKLINPFRNEGNNV